MPDSRSISGAVAAVGMLLPCNAKSSTQIPECLFCICFQPGQTVLDCIPQDVEVNSVVSVPQSVAHAADVAPGLISALTPLRVPPIEKRPRKCVAATARRRPAEAHRPQRPHGLA